MAVIRRADRLRAAIGELPLHEPVLAVTDERSRSDAVFEVEQRFVLPGAWALVATVSSLATSGDYIATTIGAEAVVVVHGRDGERRALGNVCTHRASLLAQGAGNCGRTLVCPYHGWIFGLDGRLLGVPYRTGFDEVDQDALGLTTMATAEWGSFIVVDPSGSAGELGADPALGRRLAALEWHADVPVDLDVDWKRAVLAGLTDGVESVVTGMFPTSAVFVTDDQVVAQRWEPLSPAATRLHRWSATRPADLDLSGTAPQAARDEWCTAYADALVSLVAR